jgi:poly-gamma-glutamate synthesis protein (capsule biosynthesis protein)
MPWRPTTQTISRRVRPNRIVAAALVLAVALLGVQAVLGVARSSSAADHGSPRFIPQDTRLNPNWDGDGNPVTFALGGDVNFQGPSVIASRLAQNPRTALGPGAAKLLSHANLSMVNFESALTFGGCPVPQPKTYVFAAPPTAIAAFKGAHTTLVTEANNHGEDCGRPGLLQALTIRARTHYTVLGIGKNVTGALASYQTVIRGERIGIIAATQVIDTDLVSSWTATATQPGLASAYEVQELVNAVKAARRIDDTVIVFLHWGIQLDACPDAIQEPLASQLVRAGADIVVGSHAHVLLGAGYLGHALVDYGLGNFAFYNDPYPTDISGTLVVAATGRHIDAYSWRPAIIENDLPVPATGAAARQVQARFAAARACTNLTGRPTTPLASIASESLITSPASQSTP